jgi:hypothetical protein
VKFKSVQLLGSGAALATALFLAAAASADPISLGSYGTGDSNMGNSNTALTFDGFICASATSPCPSVSPLSDFSGPPPSLALLNNGVNPVTPGSSTTYDVATAGVWAAAVANSSWVSLSPNAGPSGGVNPPDGYYAYSTTFSSTGGSGMVGSLSVMADDTTFVYLNGALVASAGSLGTDTDCAGGLPDCTQVDTIAWDPTLLAGLNTLTFVVEQTGQTASDNPTGVDFDAVLAPEPSGLLLLGTGLLGLAFLLFRRNANSTTIKPAISA